MELDARPKLNSTIATLNKCIESIQEMRTIENRKKSLQEKLVDSALTNETGEETVSKEILGLDKVLESMNARLNQNIILLGGQMKSLKSVYRQKSEKFKLGQISEAVPR